MLTVYGYWVDPNDTVENAVYNQRDNVSDSSDESNEWENTDRLALIRKNFLTKIKTREGYEKDIDWDLFGAISKRSATYCGRKYAFNSL